MRKLARVLFDESHSEAWTIRPDVAKAIQPAHPEDSSYTRAAAALRARDFAVEAHADGPLAAQALLDADVLVIAHPSDPKWERTVPAGSPVLGPDELDAIEAWVHAGGGLIVLGEEEQDKYGSNLNALLARFGLRLVHDVVSDYARHHHAPHWVLAELEPPRGRGSDVLAGVDSACFYRAGTIEAPAPARTLARTGPSSSKPGAALLAVTEAGAGRVAVLADSDLFGDDCIGDHGHEQLWTNLAYWVAEARFAEQAPSAPSPAQADPHWAALKHATDALRLRQEPDGSVAEPTHEIAEHVGAMAAAILGLRRSSRTSSSGSTAATRVPTSRARSSASGPTSTAPTASSTSSSSRCTSRTRRATRASRRSSSASPGRTGSPSSSARATTTRSSSR
jgi:hypothetical protein